MIATVDASTAVKWYFEKEYSDAASRLFSPAHTLLAPDLLIAEFANVAWKYVRRGDATVEHARDALNALLRVRLHLHAPATVMPAAFDIACESGRTAYDNMYLALARTQGCQLVNADRRFYNAALDTPYEQAMLWVENVS
ncbi:MAG: type II toxin-antitoxin system VapC family toxin [Dehalococcoidia bacterium]